MPIRSIAAEEEAGAVGIVEVAIAHDHVVAITLEVESLAIAATKADVHKAPLAILENPVFATEEHRSGHTVKGAEAATNIVRNTVFDGAFDHATDAELPLVAFFKEAVFKIQVGEVVNEGCVLVEVVGTVRPEAGCKSAEDTVFHHDVLHDDFLVGFPREEADAEADLALRVVLVAPVKQGVAEEAVFNPKVFLGGSALGVFGVDAGHAAGEFDAHDLVAALVVETDTGAVLLEILAVNEGLIALPIGTD